MYMYVCLLVLKQKLEDEELVIVKVFQFISKVHSYIIENISILISTDFCIYRCVLFRICNSHS